MTGYHAASPPVVVQLLATCTANKTADEEPARLPSGSWLRSKQLSGALCHPPPSQPVSNELQLPSPPPPWGDDSVTVM